MARFYLLVALLHSVSIPGRSIAAWRLFDDIADSTPLRGQPGAAPSTSKETSHDGIVQSKIFFNSLIYSILGVVVFWLSFIIVDKLTPYDLWGEIGREEEPSRWPRSRRMCLGIAVIVAAAYMAEPPRAPRQTTAPRPAPAAGAARLGLHCRCLRAGYELIAARARQLPARRLGHPVLHRDRRLSVRHGCRLVLSKFIARD